MQGWPQWTMVGALVLGMAGCGGGTSEGDDPGSASEDPCALATPAMVEAAFGGASSEGEAGQARNCTFQIDGGSALTVDVYYYGPSGSWEGVRDGFEENRDGTTDVPGLGTAAFHPNDAGPSELVVSAGDVIFSVSTGAFGEIGPESDAGLAALAAAIAANQG